MLEQLSDNVVEVQEKEEKKNAEQGESEEERSGEIFKEALSLVHTDGRAGTQVE